MSAFIRNGYHFHSLLHEVHNFVYFINAFLSVGSRGGAVGWGTALQTGRSLTYSLRLHHGPGDDSVSNRNDHQEYFLGGLGSRSLGMITLPSSYTDCLEIWELKTPGNFRACPGLYRDCLLLPYWFILLGVITSH